MQITVKFHGNLKKYLPQKKEQAAMEIEIGVTIRALLARLNVPDSDVWLCAINNNVVDECSALREGDTLEVFEPVGGGAGYRSQVSGM